jgi:signal transduction histidine kinase
MRRGSGRGRLALAIRAPDLLAAVEEVLLHGDGPTREVPLRLNDESRFQAFVSALTAGGGRRALCVLRDVTAEMQGEAIRRDFVANVSHELRTPLTAMMGFIETLQGQAKDDAAARARFLGIMEREAGRMNRLVRDLLHLSRVEAEERMRPRDPVDLAGVLRSAAATVRPAAAERSRGRGGAGKGRVQTARSILVDRWIRLSDALHPGHRADLVQHLVQDLGVGAGDLHQQVEPARGGEDPLDLGIDFSRVRTRPARAVRSSEGPRRAAAPRAPPSPSFSV